MRAPPTTRARDCRDGGERGFDPDFRTRQIESLRLVLKEDRGQQYSAALNASNFYATGGAYAKARPLLDIAAADPALSEKIAVLREFLKDK